jgi:hypothetical protein
MERRTEVHALLIRLCYSMCLWQNLPPLLLTPGANFPPNLRLQRSMQIFEKIQNDHSVIFRDLEEDDS